MVAARKLGCLAPREDVRTLRFSRYAASRMPALPQYVHWDKAKGSQFNMFLNDKIGDCTCAAIAHAIQNWTVNHGRRVDLTDEEVLALYVAASGYDPRTGLNDNGAIELDVLNLVRRYGIGDRKLGAFAAVNYKDLQAVKHSIHLLGCCYIGVALPLSAQEQDVWSVPRVGHRLPAWRPGSWGGHAVTIVAYDDRDGTFTVPTWGAPKRMTYDWFLQYCQESYALFSPDWVNDTTLAPNSFAMADLVADMNAITSMG